MLMALAVTQSKASARTDETRKRRREEAFVAAGGPRMNDEDAFAAVAEAEAEERACPTCLSTDKEAFIITEAGCEHAYCIECLDGFKVMHAKKKTQWNGSIGVAGAYVRVLKYGALRCPLCQSPVDLSSGVHYAAL